MRAAIQLILLLGYALGQFAFASSPKADVFWIDKYGKISWISEKARADNLAIQLLRHPDQIGYIDVRVGQISCAGEALAHALKLRRYLIEVRKVPTNQIVWRNIGYGKSFEVTYWLVPLGKQSFMAFEYQKRTTDHQVKNCKVGKHN